MAQPFGHEKLIVYHKATHFAKLRGALLHDLARCVAACDHLDRGAESILVNLNIAEGNGRFTGDDQSKFYETAYKATIQSASLLDLAGGNRLDATVSVEEGRELLRRVAAMLTALSKAVTYD